MSDIILKNNQNRWLRFMTLHRYRRRNKNNKMGPPFRQTYVSPTRWLRALYMPQLRRGIYRTLRSLVGETSVRQGAGPSWPAGGVTGPFGPRFRVFQVGSVWQYGWFSWNHTVNATLWKVQKKWIWAPFSIYKEASIQSVSDDLES